MYGNKVRSRTNSMASVPGAFDDEVGDGQTIIGPEATSTSRQGLPEESKQPDDDLDRIKTLARPKGTQTVVERLRLKKSSPILVPRI